MKASFAAAVSSFVIGVASLAPLAAAQNQQLAVTIYNDNLALVQDKRDMDLTGGRQRLEFPGVSGEIRPETVSLSATGVAIVEQNFDFDLLTPTKLMEKAVGTTITIIRVNPATGAETRERAEVLATNGGVVLKIGNRIEVLRDDGLPVRVIFDKVPDNLRSRPTLSVTISGDRRGPKPITLNYLTGGLGWRADYVALFDDKTSKLDVQGWVTLTNSSGTTYDNADTTLVAGTPLRADQYNSRQYRPQPARPQLQQAGTESGDRERLGDFYLYPLAERTTIANMQTKQVSFLDVQGVPAEHGYEFRNYWLGTQENPQSAKTVYRFSTGSAKGLGDQLPAGILRFYIRDKQGDPQFIGESSIDHTPMGSVLSLSTGDAFDIKVKPVVEKRERINLFRWKTSMRYTVTNASPREVKVALQQDGLWGDTRIETESMTSTRPNANMAEWMVTVPANGSVEVTATFDTAY
ncbi:MAG: DUF4139 domain-containing protein [Hyphomonadaceae bacterium]